MIPACQEIPNGCTGEISTWCFGCELKGLLIEEMRRYLYRNVACEARKPSGLEKHMPDEWGWM